jgi:hypothetical protein
VKTRAAIAPKVDVRADGGYIVVAPSTHPETGKEYRWVEEEGLAGQIPLAPVPEWLLPRLISDPAEADSNTSGQSVREIREGTRNAELTRLAGKLIGEGWSPDGTLDRLRVVNSRDCRPPLPDAEVAGIVRSIAAREATRTRSGGSDPVRVARTLAARPVFQRLSEVEPSTVEWLWPGYIPRGKVTLVVGDPALGKSTLTSDLAARVTTGAPMPGGGADGPAGVVLLNAEDGDADTIRPRFDAAGGDPRRVLLIPHLQLDGGAERPLSLPEDVDCLREAVRECEAQLVVMDPLVVFLSGM